MDLKTLYKRKIEIYDKNVQILAAQKVAIDLMTAINFYLQNDAIKTENAFGKITSLRMLLKNIALMEIEVEKLRCLFDSFSDEIDKFKNNELEFIKKGLENGTNL